MTAVNTLKEEFAQLAAGGYAPTEDAWKLANSQINGNYGVKDLRASLTEVQRLINYRLGAFANQRPTTVGGDSELPMEGGQSKIGGFSVRAPDGKTYSFPTQQALDTFKKAAGIK